MRKGTVVKSRWNISGRLGRTTCGRCLGSSGTIDLSSARYQSAGSRALRVRMDAGRREANNARSASGLSAGSVVDGADFTAALLAVAPDAMRLAQSLGCRSDQAADVVQEAACAAWRYRAGCRTNFRSWFLTIVRRKAATRPRDWLTLPMFWRERAGADDDPAGLAS